MLHSEPPLSDEDATAHASMPAAVAAALRRLVADVRLIAAQQLELLALEARKAARDLVISAGLGAACGVLLALAWCGVTAACALWLMESGVRTSLSVLAASALNLGAAAWALLALQKRWRTPQFSATLDSLGLATVRTGGPSP